MRYNRAKKKQRGKYKSRLELYFATLCKKQGLKFEYEPERFKYVRHAHYVPDWRIGPRTFIETKGYLAPSNRSNLLSFREQHPDITILLLFANADNKLNSRSKTTYAEWAEHNGFQWADIRKGIPDKWWRGVGPHQIKDNKDENHTNSPAKKRRKSKSHDDFDSRTNRLASKLGLVDSD